MLDRYTPPAWAVDAAQQIQNTHDCESNLNMNIRSQDMNDFLSNHNMMVIQQQIIRAVYQKSNNKFKIKEQDPIALMTVMRDMYELNKFSCKQYFNDYVTHHASENIINNIIDHVQYTSRLDPVSMMDNRWTKLIDNPKYFTEKTDGLEFNQP